MSMSRRTRRTAQTALVVAMTLLAAGLLPTPSFAGHSEIASFDARLGGGLTPDFVTTKAGMEVATGVPLVFNSNGAQASRYPGGFRTLSQPFESPLFGSIVIAGVAHNSAPVSATFDAVIRNATTGETIVTVPDIRVDDLQLESSQSSPNPEDHCDDPFEVGGVVFQITLAPTVNEVVVGPTDNLQLELVPTAVFGGGMELCVDHPHYSAMGLVVEPLAPPNQAPAAADDAVSTPKNTAVAIDVLANDSDADGDSLTVTNLSAPADGTAATQPDGSVLYTPFNGFIGTDTFTYTAHDGNADSAPATVTVTVFNQPPVAVDDFATTYKNTPVTVAVLANDSDPDGDPLTLSTVSPGGSGTTVANSDSTVTYTPDTGVSGIDTFVYSATDGTELSNAATVMVQVVNRPPDCSAAAPTVNTLWAPSHVFVPVQVLGVTDPDGDAVTVTVESIWQDEPTDTTGTGAFAPDGRGVGTSTAEVRNERMGSGDGRVYHIGFTADDGDSGTCSGTVAVSAPHDQRPGSTAVDGGALFDSTA